LISNIKEINLKGNNFHQQDIFRYVSEFPFNMVNCNEFGLPPSYAINSSHNNFLADKYLP
jgi:hypothetical protein